VLKVLLFVALVAVVLYLTIRWLQRRGKDDPPKSVPQRPMAPDDDPEFLRGLDRERRQHGETEA
jgi:hypothetical protein